jgi:hypothetical protein
MADIADVVDAVYALVLGAAYPNGTSSPSVTGKDIDIGEGWPEADDLDAASAAGKSIVSLYADPILGDPGQVQDRVGVVVAPVHGLSFTTNEDGSITLSGTPGTGEFVTFIVNYSQAYSFANPGNGTAASMAAGIAAQVAAAFPGTAASGSTVTVVGNFALTVRIGATGTLGRRVHRQKGILRVVAWAPSPSDRTVIAKAIDPVLKFTNRMIMPDTSCALMFAQGTAITDKDQSTGLYRRDLLFIVTYDTVYLYKGTEITSVGIPVSNS